MVNTELLTGLGAVCSVFFSRTGACVASVPCGYFALQARGGMLKPCIPIIISGVLAIYGLIVVILLSHPMSDSTIDLTLLQGYRSLSVGLVFLVSGCAIGGFVRGHMRSL